jgi:hypothetical protein
MNLPSGLVFYLDFQYGTDKDPYTSGNSLYGATGGNTPFGNTDTGGAYGPGRFTYSINNTSSGIVVDAVATASYSDLDYNSDYSASMIAGEWRKVTFTAADLEFADFRGVRGFQFQSASAASPGNLQESQFTSYDGTSISIIVTASLSVPAIAVGAVFTASYQLQPTDQFRGDFEDGNPEPNSLDSPSISIPQINVQMQSSAIVAKTRKLKAVWTPEFAQDLNAYHALDAEAELTSILSEYISLEIDLEILDMLMESAAAGTEVWSAVNNRSFVGNVTSDLNFYNSQGQWFQTLGTKIQKLSNIIHQKTL